jgi:hypothetical protein
MIIWEKKAYKSARARRNVNNAGVATNTFESQKTISYDVGTRINNSYGDARMCLASFKEGYDRRF